MKTAFFILLSLFFIWSLKGIEFNEKKNDYFFVSTRREPTIKERINVAFGAYADNMLAIAKCESNLDPKKVNWSDSLITGVPSWGLFQINAKEFKDWDKPAVNIASASAKLKSQGYNAWKNCTKNGLIK